MFQTEHAPVEIVGGKASSLLALYNKGFNVPPFFVITTNAVSMLKNSKAYRKLFPEIKEAYRTAIKKGKVSVRSSAVIEDSRKSSFAGQFKTVLDVDVAYLYSAIRVVYLSLPKVVAAYGLDGRPGTDKIAVIIQKMVYPEKSGVMFTADPINGNRNRIIIEAVNGLGEALVSGAKNPARYYVSRTNSRILSRTSNLVTSRELKQLRDIAVSIEKLFDYPQDIEFAIKNRVIYILQSRDITTLQG